MENETCSLPKPQEPVALSPDVWVGPAPKPGTLQKLASAGFRSIINNQPDTDSGLLMNGLQVEAEAKSCGLGYAFIPIEGRNPLERDVRAFSQALTDLPRPIFAYCRTGGRSASLWAMASVLGNDTDSLISRCHEIGFDISGLRTKMDMRRDMLSDGDWDE
ncbi:MAG: hypothetical protein JSS54_14870 [Proteobacteria bacterium]|nr:hypothetical protein [Pseudomonadota bacterium]